MSHPARSTTRRGAPKSLALDVVRPITHPIETVGARLTLVSMQSGIG
jgi:hypothetical protein